MLDVDGRERILAVHPAFGEDRRGAAGDVGEEERGGVVAAELQVAAKGFGVDVDAAFFDFELADVAGAQMLGKFARAER